MHDMPLEMYRAVSQHLGRQDLTMLARVSSTVQHEAEAILYSHVDLCQATGGHREHIITWCFAVTKVQRKARHVNTLKFPAAFRQPLAVDPNLDIEETISNAFKAIVNLTHLFLLGGSQDPRHYTLPLHLSTLKDCTFRLESLAGDTLNLQGENMLELLSQHPDIEYWVPTHTFLASFTSFPDDILPRLRQSVLTNPAKIGGLKGRPVEALVLLSLDPVQTKSVGLGAITPLRLFSNTLHTLVYTHASLQGWTTADFIHSIAQNAPRLVSLTLGSFSPTASITTVGDQKNLVEAVAEFQNLVTLVVDTNMQALYLPNKDLPDSSNLLEHTETWQSHSLSPAQCRRVASTFMASCSRLRRLSFPIKPDSKPVAEPATSLTYFRSETETNTAVFDGFYTLDTSGWWMR